MASSKPLVLVVGATGKTGSSIVNGLLAAGNFHVAAVIRPTSLSKPATETLRAAGVEIRVGDVTDSVDKLKAILSGVEILISAVVGWKIDAQRDIFRVAKEVGVQRVIPCDFATPGARGVRRLHDQKLEIREFIKDLGVPYTFIDVGWWMQLFLPFEPSSSLPTFVKEASWKLLEGSDPLVLLTDATHIGTFVARIIADPRTLNHAVIVWEDQVTLSEAHEIAESVSSVGDELKAHRIYVQPDEFLKQVAIGDELLKKDPKNADTHMLIHENQYLHSMYVLQENTLENAKRLGYLDARELYPDIVPISLKEFAKGFYASQVVLEWAATID